MPTYDATGPYDDDLAEAALRIIGACCPDLASDAARALLTSGAPRQMRLDRLVPDALAAGTLDDDQRSLLMSCVGVGLAASAPGGERRSTVVQIRLTPSERDHLAHLAAAEGTTISDLIRSRVLVNG